MDPLPPETPKPFLERIPAFLRDWRFWVLLFPLFTILSFQLANRPAKTPPPSPAPPERVVRPVVSLPTPTPIPRGMIVGSPTPHQSYADLEDKSIYMPTGSGRVRSAHFGSTRTASSGRARFHEGVDLAPTKRDSRQRALDDIYAVADGKVAYISRRGGNSSYGVYIVLLHKDEVGEIYTLYSHLTSVDESLRSGQQVKRGQRIGRMGHSSTLGIPVQRAHLHLEIGLVLNSNFEGWYRSKGLSPNHRAYHGWNLYGADPQPFLQKVGGPKTARHSFKDQLEREPAAFQLILKSRGVVDFFKRYPSLWKSDGSASGVLVLDLTENGVILQGRKATAEEQEGLGSSKAKVLQVHEEVLGRNGPRLIYRRSGNWVLSDTGARWREMLLYGAQ